jgi:hypothetical protein
VHNDPAATLLLLLLLLLLLPATAAHRQGGGVERCVGLRLAKPRRAPNPSRSDALQVCSDAVLQLPLVAKLLHGTATGTAAVGIMGDRESLAVVCDAHKLMAGMCASAWRELEPGFPRYSSVQLLSFGSHIYAHGHRPALPEVGQPAVAEQQRQCNKPRGFGLGKSPHASLFLVQRNS